jgi:hypothetical protein
MCDGGRDLEGAEWVEYCDSLCLEACEVGRANVVLREGGEVTIGANGGAFGLEEGDVAGEDEAPGEPSNAGITAAIFASDYGY